jgi:hypothetical protein
MIPRDIKDWNYKSIIELFEKGYFESDSLDLLGVSLVRQLLIRQV